MRGWCPLLPLTTPVLIALAAVFKEGDYRSFPNYLSTAKAMRLDAGHPWDSSLEHVSKWITRSVLRGIGPSRQSAALHLDRLLALDPSAAPLVSGGPMFPRNVALLGCMFLLREVELSATRLSHLTIDPEERTIKWLLTISKTDPSAQGVSRVWGCLCSSPGVPCPYHLATAVLDHIYAQSDYQCLTTMQAGDLPFVRTMEGTSPSKQSMLRTIELLAARAGLPLTSPDGLRLFGGHSLRVTGAQALARWGVPVETIRIMARHSGEAVLRYVADAPVSNLSEQVARQAQLRVSNPDNDLASQVSSLRLQMQKQDETIRDLSALVRKNDHIAFVQNVHTLAVHGLRPGDSSTSMCGWKLGPAKLKRGSVRYLSTIKGEPWHTLCERCLQPERAAAKAIACTNAGDLDRSD